MTAAELHTLFATQLTCTELRVQGEDGRHFEALLVSTAFEGLPRVRRHQKIYALLDERIQRDEVHALSLKTYTPAEWAAQAAL